MAAHDGVAVDAKCLALIAREEMACEGVPFQLRCADNEWDNGLFEYACANFNGNGTFCPLGTKRTPCWASTMPALASRKVLRRALVIAEAVLGARVPGKRARKTALL